LKFKSVAAGVSPSLSGKVVKAFPDLHLSTVSWSTRSGVKAEVSSGELDFGVTIIENPLLGVTTIAVKDLDSSTISKDCAPNIHTLGSVTIVVEGSPLGRGRGRRWSGTSISGGTFEPNLVVIACATRPNLELIRIGQVSVRQIETEICALENDMVIIGVGPLLSSETIEALPYLHFNTIGGATAGIEADISTIQLNTG
jgi:hypothetical protein